MFTNTLKLIFTYTQRALTPKQFSNLLQKSSSISPNSTPSISNLKQIMHNLYLYENDITIFDYDYYQKVCYKLIDYQKKLRPSQILTVLKLGIKHNVKNQILWRHLENQIHHRLYNTMNPVFQFQSSQFNNMLGSFVRDMEKQKVDRFGILVSQFIQEQKLEQKQEQQVQKQPNNKIQHQPNTPKSSDSTIKTTPKQIKNQIKNEQKNPIKIITKKQNILKYAYQLVQILIWYGTQNHKLINLLLQTQLHPNILQNTPNAAIKFAELLVYACQINMRIYQQNKNKYTARSIKGIYKYQGVYFPYLMKNIKASLENFSVQEIKYIVEVVGGFPLKKRQHRYGFVSVIVEQWKNRGNLPSEDQKARLVEILGKDQKLIRNFKLMIGQDEAQNQSKKIGDSQEVNQLNSQIQTKNEQQKTG